MHCKKISRKSDEPPLSATVSVYRVLPYVMLTSILVASKFKWFNYVAVLRRISIRSIWNLLRIISETIGDQLLFLYDVRSLIFFSDSNWFFSFLSLLFSIKSFILYCN